MGRCIITKSCIRTWKRLRQFNVDFIFIDFFRSNYNSSFLHYFSFKYRGEPGKKALFYADNNRLEAIWTIIPVITLAGLIIYGLYTWTNIMTVEENDEALVVELYAQQFNWKARYSVKMVF